MDIKDVFRIFKIPILLGGISLVCIVLSIVLLVKSTQTTTPIEFLPADEAGSSSSATLTVDIEGAVTNPGVYTLPVGSRVEDALASAGGLKSDADTDLFAKTFNRAAKIIDGAKIYIPSVNTNQTSHNLDTLLGSSATSQNGLPVSVNFATISELDVLPGVGPVTAQKIIDNRPYQTLDELVSKKAIGPSLYEKLKNSLSL